MASPVYNTQAGRQNRIAEMVLRNTAVSIQDLVEMFHVSAMTIHRDLDELEQQGILRKVRGGATAQPTYLFESHLNYRLNSQIEEKQAIAAAALAHIEPGEAVMLDDSTTVLALARRLVEIPHLTVITNFLSIVEILRPYRQINLISLGGDYQFRHNSVAGALCEQMISCLRVNTLFMSFSAVGGGYAFHQEEPIVRVKRAMVKSALRRILLVDHTKLGKQALREAVPLTDFDLVIVDSQAEPDKIESIREMGIPVEIVPLQ
jgi:DeoR/GlpR family transcriptional regulator of sugar metabolism